MGNKSDSQTDHHHNPIKLFFELCKAEAGELGVIITYEVGIGLLSLTIPIGVQIVVNTIAFTQLAQPILFLALAVLFGQIVGAILKVVQVVIAEKLQRRLFTQIGMEMAYRIPRMLKSRSERHELVNRFFDVVTIQKSVSSLFIDGVALALQMIIGLVLLGFYHPVLLAFDLVLVSTILFIIFVLGRGAVDSSINESVEKYRVAAWLEDLASKKVTFSSKSARYFALERANEIVGNYLSARKIHFRILLRQVIGFLSLQAIANTSLLALGVWLISVNQLSIGQLVAAEIVVSTVLYSLTRFQKHLDSFYDLTAALDKVATVLDQPLEEAGLESISFVGPFTIEFRDVVHTFPNSAKTLGPYNFTVQAGDKLAIHGCNGSGKSVIIDFLYGLKRPYSGVILINGHDIKGFSPEALREKIALIRDVELVAGSILKNLKIGHPLVSIDEINDSLRRVGIFDEIITLPQGIETIITQEGLPLSVSQTKRLMLARAILGNPGLILVDETFDGLDDNTRPFALNALFDEEAPWTVIVTSQHSGIEDRCDQILNLDIINGTR